MLSYQLIRCDLMDEAVPGAIGEKRSKEQCGSCEPVPRGRICHRDMGHTRQCIGASRTGCVPE
jgi:hypothetical protein